MPAPSVLLTKAERRLIVSTPVPARPVTAYAVDEKTKVTDYTEKRKALQAGKQKT